MSDNLENTEQVQSFMLELLVLCRKYRASFCGDDTQYYPSFSMGIGDAEIHQIDIDHNKITYRIGDEFENKQYEINREPPDSGWAWYV